ncbi:hypothetical protein P3L10_033112 [Capsicum annuum]
MAGGDPLSDLPRSILLYILSMLPNGKQVVRTSVLSRRWRFLWNSVPLSLNFEFPNRGSIESTLDYVTSIHRELYYLRSCEKIRKFRVLLYRYDERYAKDVDLWVHFATKVANVKDFELIMSGQIYEMPKFAYMNTYLRNLVLWGCQLNPSGSLNWSSLVSLSIV